MIRVILAGEGKNELGEFATEPAFRPEKPMPGVLETLLRHVRPDGWRVVDAIPWKKTPKLQVGLGGKGEALNVQRAYYHAQKRGCDIFAFSRDRDHEKFVHRDLEIEQAIEALASSKNHPAIVGGVAIEKLESWVLAVAGIRHSETLRQPEEKLRELGIPGKDTAAMTQFIADSGFGKIPDDAHSLRRWLERAGRALQDQT